jgi:acylphosphatase
MTPPVPERLDVFVRGVVQGVGYRYFALREAMGLGLDGYVSNERDGSVHVVAEGPRAELESYLAILEEGPPAALVEEVRVSWEPARGFVSGFRIESGYHRGD